MSLEILAEKDLLKQRAHLANLVKPQLEEVSFVNRLRMMEFSPNEMSRLRTMLTAYIHRELTSFTGAFRKFTDLLAYDRRWEEPDQEDKKPPPPPVASSEDSVETHSSKENEPPPTVAPNSVTP